MHQFICKYVKGKIVPIQENKLKRLERLLNSYGELDKKFKVTIEIIEKNINEQQISLYNAFIIKAANHFGNTFNEMEIILKRFWPRYDMNTIKALNKWTTKELDTFINQASALLAEQGFKF
jgi:hypothetical protein